MENEENRRWRACAFVRFSAPELSLDHRKFAALATKWMTVKEARDQIWDMKYSVKAKGLEFWIEPDHMTKAEVKVYRPMDVRDCGISIE